MLTSKLAERMSTFGAQQKCAYDLMRPLNLPIPAVMTQSSFPSDQTTFFSTINDMNSSKPDSDEEDSVECHDAAVLASFLRSKHPQYRQVDQIF